MLEITLEKLGLSEKEAKVYLAALELGVAAVQKIAEKAKINRPTAYVILESLTKKGLVTTYMEGKKTLFTAEPPERLKLLLEKMEDDVRSKKAELTETMPQLKAIFNLAGNKPKVKFYEGIDGINALNREDVVRTPANSTSYAFNNLDYLFHIMPNKVGKDVDIRIKKKTAIKVIYTRKEGPLEDASDPAKLREARFVPREIFPFDATISINPGKEVYIYNYEGSVCGLLIEDPGIANAMKAIWNLAWEGAEKYNK